MEGGVLSRVIGIDLGTTNSCVAFIDSNGEAVVVPNSEGSRTTPSVVAYGVDGQQQVGNPAKRQAATKPERTIYAVKRLMGLKRDSDAAREHAGRVPYEVCAAENGDAWVRVGQRTLSPPEVSAAILRDLRQAAESFLGEEVSQAVVTVPAYFNDAQRQATRDAGKVAGLDVQRIVNEPTAAALAFGFREKSGRTVAVYDLGGGTFDISLLRIDDGVFKVLSTSGDTHLGGEDVDQLIVEHAARQFEGETQITLQDDPAALQRLKDQAEKTKKELSSSLETEINLPFIAANASGPKHLIMPLRRSELEGMVADIVERTLVPCKQALEDARIKPSQVDEVILVGGMTRMPYVQKRVADFFGRAPSRNVNPDEVVAVGAALQAAALAGQVDEVLLLDVTPLSLGVETGGGVFHRLIPRNTTVPTRVTESFTTSIDNQPFVPIHVLQGEREMALDNKSLAKFELAPILPAPRGVPQIEVTFDIDTDGIVEVTAKDLATCRNQNVRIVASSGLTEEQVAKLVHESDAHRADDLLRRELAELKNGAEALLYTSGRAVEECTDLVEAATLEGLEQDRQRLQALLEQSQDAEGIRDALLKLENSAFALAESMYGTVDDEEEAAP